MGFFVDARRDSGSWVRKHKVRTAFIAVVLAGYVAYLVVIF